MLTEAFVSIGSNIDREKNCLSALDSLKNIFGALRTSSLYESKAVGFEGNPFYNCVIAFQTDRNIEAVRKILSEIENEHGRLRSDKKFSSRTLDLDLILFGNSICLKQGIPRDEIEQYAFVLEPLAEIAPELTHPVSGISYQDMWAKFDKSNLHQKRITFPRQEQ